MKPIKIVGEALNFLPHYHIVTTTLYATMLLLASISLDEHFFPIDDKESFLSLTSIHATSV